MYFLCATGLFMISGIRNVSDLDKTGIRYHLGCCLAIFYYYRPVVLEKAKPVWSAAQVCLSERLVVGLVPSW